MSEPQRTPEFLEYFDEGIHSFTYDHAAAQFTIAGTDVSLTDTDLLKELAFPAGVPTPVSEILDRPLYMMFGRPLTTPMFSKWVREHCGKNEILATKKVIFETMRELTGITFEAPPKKAKLESIFGAEVYFLRPGHPAFQTIGNCACMGVLPDGDYVRENDFDSGYAEFGFHNVDNNPQRISLLAGIGHMATLAQRAATAEM